MFNTNSLNLIEWYVGCLFYLHCEVAFLITFRHRVRIWGENGCWWQRTTRIIPHFCQFSKSSIILNLYLYYWYANLNLQCCTYSDWNTTLSEISQDLWDFTRSIEISQDVLRFQWGYNRVRRFLVLLKGN